MNRFRQAVVFGLFAASVLFAAMGWQSYATATPSVAKDGDAVLPFLSPRRLPELAGELTQESLLRDAAAKAVGGIPSGSVCVAVQREGRPVFSDDVNTPYTPASTAKLLTATAALNELGANHHFTTRVVGDKPKDGMVSGSIYLVGGGDPLLTTNDFVAATDGHHAVHSSMETLADAVVANGVKTIRGGVVGDDTRFDTERYLASWDPNYRVQGQVGPIGALMVNQGFVNAASPERTAAPDPAMAAATIFASLLRARGVDVAADGRVGDAPADSQTLGELASVPVAEMVREMLTESDNTTAEMLLKNLGVEKAKQGSFAAGARVIVTSLQDADYPIGGVQLVDGSGLDRLDRVTCNALAAILARDGVGGYVATSLAKAGETGTLATRFLNTAAVGRLQAKTGTLSGVSGLAGWAHPEDQSPFNFVVITNGLTTSASRVLEDQIVLLLVNQPKGRPQFSR